MALSYTLAQPLGSTLPPRRRAVLVTGASGNIGSYFAEHTARRYRLRLMVREESERSALEQFGEVVVGELRIWTS